MTVLKEHDRIVLAADVPTEGLVAGDVRTDVHVDRERNKHKTASESLDKNVSLFAPR